MSFDRRELALLRPSEDTCLCWPVSRRGRQLKEGSPPIVSVTLNQETLAAMIGTTRSRVSFFMNKFRKLGFIDYNGTIHVYQSLLNDVLREKPEIKNVGQI